MTTTRGGLLSVLSRTDNPRRETLRAELARTKPAGTQGGLEAKARACKRLATPPHPAGAGGHRTGCPAAVEHRRNAQEGRDAAFAGHEARPSQGRRCPRRHRQRQGHRRRLCAGGRHHRRRRAAHSGEAPVHRRSSGRAAAPVGALPSRAHRTVPDCAGRSCPPENRRHAGALQTPVEGRDRGLHLPRASGAARPAATPFRGWRDALCRSSPVLIRTWSGCR